MLPLICSTCSLQTIILSLFYSSSITTPTSALYTLSLHDALPISLGDDPAPARDVAERDALGRPRPQPGGPAHRGRSEEHTSELQSLRHIVCRLLLEKKNNNCVENESL